MPRICDLMALGGVFSVYLIDYYHPVVLCVGSGVFPVLGVDNDIVPLSLELVDADKWR